MKRSVYSKMIYPVISMIILSYDTVTSDKSDNFHLYNVQLLYRMLPGGHRCYLPRTEYMCF